MGTYIPVTPGKIAPLAWLPDPLQATGKLALVCEGGGQRGIFTAGVLDEFLKAGFNPFDLLIGTSAGAQNLSAYLCGQRGYARHVITRYTTDKQFFNPLRFIRGGNLIDLDWLISSTSAECPLNIAHALRRFDQGQEFYMCASRADNLDAAYFSPQAEDWLEYIKASSAIPGFYREGVEIDGITYHDGGISDAVPVIEAWRKCNADTSKRIQKINTRDVAYAVEQACQQKSLKGDGIDMLWSALVAGALALLSALSDNVWFNGKSPIWLVVMVAWFIGIVPNLIDIAKWLLGVRSSFKTVVYLE